MRASGNVEAFGLRVAEARLTARAQEWVFVVSDLRGAGCTISGGRAVDQIDWDADKADDIVRGTSG